MRAFLLSAIASLACTAPAMAEDFRAEVHAGWDRLNGGGDHQDGVLYGIGIGYDLPVGEHLTLGVEANLDDSTAKECETIGATRYCGKAGRDISVNGRIGYRLNERGTIYALAGYTNGRVTSTARSGSVTLRSSDNLDGVRIGVGYQHNLSDRFYAKAEYRYSNYEAGVERHQLLTGIGLRI